VERRGTPQHVLVIDDDQSHVALYRDVLAEDGYRVTAVTSPDLEPREITSVAPDLILLDLRFQNTNGGIALLRQLKTTPRTQTIPVLVCSADHHQLAALQDQLVAWDCGILAKPFHLDELLAAIHACLASTVPAVPPANRGVSRLSTGRWWAGHERRAPRSASSAPRLLGRRGQP
jgi:two-component system OmpR family response regulator